MNDAVTDDEYQDDDFPDERDDCTRCCGTGFVQSIDPLWDEVDEFGDTPCVACHGTGLRSHQWIF